MAKKIIYFVRHGETEDNAKNIKQGAEGHLSAKGREQALSTAARFPKEKGRPQVIISSPYQRTKETAEIIASVLGMKVKYSKLLVEKRNPSQIVGREDEENFIDLKKRAKKLLKYIARRSEKRIIMVTHGIFLKMVVSYMLYGNKLTASEYNNLSYFNPIDNAGMAIVSYTHHWFRRNEWKILTWND